MTILQNNDIVSNLLHQDSIVQQEVDNSLQLTSTRVANTRFKVYALIIGLVIALFTNRIFLPARDSLQDSQSSLQTLVTEINNFEAKRQKYIAQTELYQSIQEQQDLIVQCYNEQEGCEQLPSSVIENLVSIADFLNMQDLQSDPMIIDERRILRNINEFLLQTDPTNITSPSRNGTINDISISDPQVYQNNINRVPLTLTIRFQDQNALLSFLDNVEHKIAPDPEKRVRYIIDQVKYDVSNYQQEQEVQIDMSAFYAAS